MGVFFVTGKKLDQEVVLALYDAANKEEAKKKAVQNYTGIIKEGIRVYDLEALK